MDIFEYPVILEVLLWIVFSTISAAILYASKSISGNENGRCLVSGSHGRLPSPPPTPSLFTQTRSANGVGMRRRQVAPSEPRPESRAADSMINSEPNLKRSRLLTRELVTRCALLIVGGYILTLISIVFLYRWQESAFLFSDAVPCANNTQTSYSDSQSCDYNLVRDVSDVFLPIDALDGSPILHLWWIRSRRPTSTDRAPLTVIFTHGNVDNIVSYKPIYSWLTDQNVDVVAWDYPGYGKSSGSSDELTITAAAESVMRHVTEDMGVPEQRVVLWGYSLGGSVVTQLAGKHSSVAGVILQSPIDSAADVLRNALPLTGWAITLLATQHFDTKSRMGSLLTCLVLFIGSDDEQFSVEREAALYERAIHADPSCSSFVEIEGLNHFDDPTKNKDFMLRGEEFLRKIMLKDV